LGEAIIPGNIDRFNLGEAIIPGNIGLSN
jgi:hypothetical protein